MCGRRTVSSMMRTRSGATSRAIVKGNFPTVFRKFQIAQTTSPWKAFSLNRKNQVAAYLFHHLTRRPLQNQQVDADGDDPT
jgi:hypothetical protein